MPGVKFWSWFLVNVDSVSQQMTAQVFGSFLLLIEETRIEFPAPSYCRHLENESAHSPNAYKQPRAGPGRNQQHRTPGESPTRVSHHLLCHRAHTSRQLHWKRRSKMQTRHSVIGTAIPSSVLTAVPNIQHSSDF